MKPYHKLNIINGFGNFIRSFTMKLLLFFPIFGIVFIGWGDRFLPTPLNSWSVNARARLNNILIGSFMDDFIKNSDYNNKKSDKLIEEVEKKSRER